MNPRPPVPPFTEETARLKVRAAEDAWNSRDPERVALAYTVDTEWRNRAEFLNGRAPTWWPGGKTGHHSSVAVLRVACSCSGWIRRARRRDHRRNVPPPDVEESG